MRTPRIQTGCISSILVSLWTVRVNKLKNMHTTVRLSVPQRKSFITLVKDAKVRQQAKLDSERYDWARNVRRDFIARNVPDEAKQIAKEITALREKVRRGEQQLDTLGFVLQYDGTFSLSNAAPASLERACDERVELHAAMRN